MTDQFTDVFDTSDDSGGSVDGDDGPTAVTDSYTATDGVRTTLPEDDSLRNDDRYSDDDSENKADDVDPRKLFRKPTLNELRYYAREGPYGKAIIEKPIEDIFKHGFEVTGDNTEREDDGKGRIADFLDDYKPHYKLAEIKSRRDGMAVLMHKIADSAASAAESIPARGGNLTGFEVYTVDNLSEELADSTVADHTKYDQDEIYVTEETENGGVAIVDDISHPNNGEIVGYGVKPRQESTDVETVNFVHAERCQHFVWGEHVDGELGNNVTGKHVGESVLTPVLQPLKGAQLGYWSLKEILHRYSAPLHAVEPPESWGQDDYDEGREKLDDLSMASSAVLPPGSELNVAEATSEFDPVPTYEVFVESTCAGTEFTKSVLQGTQTGTVSGSETDLKGYFNEVHLLRTERTFEKFREAVQMVAAYDQSTIPRVAGVEDFGIDWGPLFKPTDIERMEGAVSFVTGLSSAIKQYVLTPEEARSVLEEQWAELDIDVALDELTEDDLDALDRINMREAGQGPMDDEDDASPRQNPRLQNGGGQPEGQTRERSQPTRDDSDDVDDVLSEIPDERLEAELAERSDD